jgi:regulator of sigma E protease
MSVPWLIAAFVLVLTPVVLAHELGHFLAARLCSIRIEEFGLGLPPRAAKLFTHKGTLYSLNWVMIGGFVRPAGENDPSVPGGLAAASWPARLFVLAAGAGANFLLAMVVLWSAFLLGPKATEVTAVLPHSPAMTAGLQPGDVLLTMNGVKVDSPRIMADIGFTQGGQPVTLTVLRKGEQVMMTLTPRRPGEYDAAREGPMGIEVDQLTSDVYLHRTPREAAVEAVDYLWQVVTTTLGAPGQLARGEMSAADARPVSVVGLSQIAGKAAANSVITSSFFPVLLMIGLINVALGLTQLLPLPALDGGRIIFVLIEAVRGRRIPSERETAVHRAGMYILLLLMVVLILRDFIDPIMPF